MNDYINHLLPYLPPSKIRTLSCGHVIPKENLLAWPITTGPNGMDFEFTYEKRNQPTTIDELGNCILQLAKCIPDGIVIFFPSYSYLEQVITRWKRTASTNQTTLWTSLSSIKPIFLENKETSSVDSVLTSYTNSTNTGKGAILLSVVGGKMSEGINFSDKLARGVLIVGLPFPNAQTAEWKAKLEYIEGKTISQGGSKAEGKIAAKEFYENSCMRAVNQCIGRAIRHKGDYAFIGLVDRRYNTERIQSKLPKWIRSGLPESGKEKRTVGEVIKSVTGFFEVVR